MESQVEEVYTLVKAVKDVVVYSQTTLESTAHGGLQKTILLGIDAFEPMDSLEVLHVRPIGQSEPAPKPSVRAHTELTKVAVATREALLDALATRLVRPRYGAGLVKHSHLYDMAQFLSPETRGMPHLTTIKESTMGRRGGFTNSPGRVKRQIIHQMVSLLVKGILKSQERRAAAPKAPVIQIDAPSAKRFKSGAAPAVSAEQARRAKLTSKRMVDLSSDEEEGDESGQSQTDPVDEAHDILFKWENHKVRKTRLNLIVLCIAQQRFI